ncbi:MAG: glycosyl hydrolase 115 family protein [Clostridia bacterium]|nr:glycosyl hydrolase 115 family protein [Clostridia bacterium]
MDSFLFSLSTRIIADESVSAVRHAADILRRDMGACLTGAGPENMIRVLIDPALPEETYKAQVTEEAIILCCGDDLGAAYALLSVSEKLLHVKPLGWWMGLKPDKKENVSVPCQDWESPEYKVRFRGWFVNDEVLFSGWHSEENARAEVWERVFETILRCGGNMVIPGTDRGFDGHALNEMALERGLWLTQHHTELLGAKMFARVYPDLQASYTLYPDKYERLWQEAIDRYAGNRVVWAVGFRGQGDRAFWEDDAAADTAEKRGAFIAKVMRRQMELVRAKDPSAHFCTNLYGEMMALYREGFLAVPEGVIKLWGDNGFGKMVSRRQNNLNPRTDAMPAANEPGENGIYYHVSFYDLQAANHITPLQIPPQMVADELKTILNHHADTLWNINVGSVYPHPFLLDLVSRIWKTGEYDAFHAAREFARTYYGKEEIASLFTDYAESAVFYGPHRDDRAGDQYYHWPLRALAHALLCGETEKPVHSLLWAANCGSFLEQVKRLAAVVQPGIASWRGYVRKAQAAVWALEDSDPSAAARLRDRECLYSLIHQTGCEGLYAFCQACAHAMGGNDLQAYLWTDRALQCHREALHAMEQVRGRFAHIYRNDCFSGVSLTVQVLEAARAWLRIRGDGEYLFKWEKQYLVPREEALLSLQSHRTIQLSDDELCLRLRGEIPLEPAF